MRLHSLRARIALVFVVLMLLAQAAAYIVINSVILKNAHENAEEQLSVAERVFGQVLRSNSQQLTQAASVAASDFGFREAVATHDSKTVASALQNHGDRIHADAVMLVDLDGKLIADTDGAAHEGMAFPFPHLIRTVAQKGDASSFGMIGGKAYQLVAVPVKAPIVIAWVVMGFAIDDVLAREMSSLTSLDVSFLTVDERDRWDVVASSLPEASRVRLKDQAQLADDGYATRMVRLHSEGRTVAVLLDRSLKEALAPFRRLQSALLLITMLGVIVSIVGSVLTARSVTRPLAALAQFSRRVGHGDYSGPIEIRHQDEIGELASAFNQMQEGIVERESRITELAYMDRLTGLPNRALFNDRLQHAIVAASGSRRPLSVMMMDLDRFKLVNDTLGHPIGDLLLCEVAGRLRAALHRPTDTVARLGGDEFAVLLPEGDLAAARVVAARMLRALEEPITIEGQLVDVGASIGIVIYPEHGTDMNVLLRRADIAMYAAKRANLGHALYDARHDHNSAERLSLMGELRQAVEHDQLTLYYQPKVDLATHRVTHVEALVRWDHPTRGFVSPDQFIPFAEQTGYIKTITRWVADKALAQCAAWRAEGIELAVSVNVSARELILSSLPEMFQGLLEKHGVAPDRLWIEITESAIMDDPNHAIETLDRLHALGIRLSIDDFGTGYSSLSYLKRMPVDELKIDKSFVMGMTHHKDDETIVRSTIDLGHNMGLKVVAEGVENEAMMQRLNALGCDLAQGFHLSRPLPPAKLAQWLIEQSAQADAFAEPSLPA
ncbi:putative bifunctional diguanylate cyclase/phosphodiesterase [Caballeronia concitans]|uniref:Response regulator receiver modulated diguanylate cyclase/phosphodiesterase n=1 Tax=Caballeronia concitans TaxID=1777133 RepID=A0A658QXW3_9BURK|nr:EAL domain-containing protein [Caballeronia concitans]KIG03203.1 diguanylate cyclase/phosphodiesterase with integral membrane sensor [Burkholderia sp. MR1]SAL31487.1 response regulator receiver modulated diguanylate cyclase/phosphodiesterase [Caballeronia concitans]